MSPGDVVQFEPVMRSHLYSCSLCKAVVTNDWQGHIDWHLEVEKRITAAAQTADPRLWSDR